MPAEQVRPRQGAVLFQRDAGRAGPQQKRDPNTGPRSATYTHVPTPCKVAQPMDRAQHCHCLRSCRSDPSIIGGPGRGLQQSPAPPPPPRAHTRLHSPPQRKEPVDPSNDGLTRLPGGRVDRPHACAGCCCCNRGLKRCWPIWPLRLCLPRSAGARQHAGMHGHRRAGTPHACARQGQAGKGPVCRSRSRRARAPARTPCARGGGSMRPVHHPIPSRNDADRARPSKQ
jgi:hypothetical protein